MIIDDEKTAAEDDGATLLVNESETYRSLDFRPCDQKLPLITVTVPGRDGTLPAGTPVAATSVTGGNIRPRAGSGTLTFKDDQVEAGDDVSRITLIYEAATALEDVTLDN